MNKAAITILIALLLVSCKKDNEPLETSKRIKRVVEVTGNDTIPKEEYTYNGEQLSEWKRYAYGETGTATITYTGNMVRFEWNVDGLYVEMDEIDFYNERLTERRFYEIDNNEPLLNSVTTYTYEDDKLAYCTEKRSSEGTLKLSEEHQFTYADGYLQKYTHIIPDAEPEKAGEGEYTWVDGMLASSQYTWYSSDVHSFIQKREYKFENGNMASIKYYNLIDGTWEYQKEQTFIYDADGYLIKNSFSDSPKSTIYLYENGRGNASRITSDPLKIIFPLPEIN